MTIEQRYFFLERCRIGGFFAFFFQAKKVTIRFVRCLFGGFFAFFFQAKKVPKSRTAYFFSDALVLSISHAKPRGTFACSTRSVEHSRRSTAGAKLGTQIAVPPHAAAAAQTPPSTRLGTEIAEPPHAADAACSPLATLAAAVRYRCLRRQSWHDTCV